MRLKKDAGVCNLREIADKDIKVNGNPYTRYAAFVFGIFCQQEVVVDQYEGE